MNKCRKICVLIPILLLFAVCFCISANAEANYVFKDFHIKMDVGEDNSYKITETIKCHFTESSHGIYRKIPLINKVQRADGSTTRNKAYVTDVSCNVQYTVSVEDNYYTLKIGDPSTYADENTKYVIEYTYNIGKDNSTDFDELYFNLYGTEWEGSAEHISFEINMPKEFDKSKLGFSYGRYGSTDAENVKYKVKGNKIIGELLVPLNPSEGLTVRCELPEGYFSEAKSDTDYFSLFCFIISSLGFASVLLMFYLSLRARKKYAPTVEFYPPENLLCTDLACVLKGKVDIHQVVAVIFHLAQKGYIKITDDNLPYQKHSGKGSYTFVKQKEYDGNNKVEQLVFDGLFGPGLFSNVGKDRVSSSDLSVKFYNKLKQAIREEYKHSFTNQGNENFFDRVFKKGRRFYKNITIVSIIIMAIIGIIIPLFSYHGKFDSSVFMITLKVNALVGLNFCIFFIVFVDSIISFISKKEWRAYFYSACLLIIAVIFFCGEEFSTMQKLSIKGTLIYIAVSIIIYIKTDLLRTDYGNELYAKTIGFKKFLQIAEKPKLEELVSKNPGYFFDILPYTFALGVSKKWIDKFTSIMIPQPDWYVTNSYFNYACMHGIYESTYGSMMHNVAPKSSGGGGSGGGSSGGGSSGGGSGGGGGGSW